MYHGILPIIKPKGMTSHDVVFKMRKLLRMKKIGHTGTLDPNVSGVLLLCLGQGTKLVELLMDGVKGYRGEITLGIATETEDADGAIVAQSPVTAPIANAIIDAAMQTMEGDIIQVPPMYSAVKVAGKRLYEYARAGQSVTRPERSAHIYRFQRLGDTVMDEVSHTQRWAFDVLCGKGTYVRTLAVDLGAKLGYPSHMSQLERYQTGGFKLSQSYTLEEVADAVAHDTVADLVIPLSEAVSTMPKRLIDTTQWSLVRNGQVLLDTALGAQIIEPTAVFYAECLYAIYAPHPTKKGQIKPLRMFVYEE